MASDKDPCQICGTPASVGPSATDTYATDCPRCGRFSMTGTTFTMLGTNPLKGRQTANASGWLRENQGVTLDSRDVDFLRTVRAPTVHDRAMKVLQEIARRFPQVGESFDTNKFLARFPGDKTVDPSWLAVSWSAQFDELNFLFDEYLVETLVAVRREEGNPFASITPHGHELLEKLREGNPESPIGFCAMWFDDALKPLWTDAIAPAIRAAGYDPKRVDQQHEHTNKIDDE